jgi:hypothetical protein
MALNIGKVGRRRSLAADWAQAKRFDRNNNKM